jgi:hypothetical protein
VHVSAACASVRTVHISAMHAGPRPAAIVAHAYAWATSKFLFVCVQVGSAVCLLLHVGACGGVHVGVWVF